MKKVIVIGCSGAGKSTFSRKLKQETDLLLFHLDRLWHNKDKTTVTNELFDKRLSAILKKDAWILDGDFIRTLDIRLKECDTVFFLDYPLETCLAGVASRIGKPREDMPWIETEFDDEFRQWIIDFEEKRLPVITKKLSELGEDKQIYIFKTRDEADIYLANLRKNIE